MSRYYLDALKDIRRILIDAGWDRDDTDEHQCHTAGAGPARDEPVNDSHGQQGRVAREEAGSVRAPRGERAGIAVQSVT